MELKEALETYITASEEMKALKKLQDEAKKVIMDAHGYDSKTGVIKQMLLTESNAQSQLSYRNTNSLDLDIVKSKYNIDLSKLAAPDCYTKKTSVVLNVKRLVTEG